MPGSCFQLWDRGELTGLIPLTLLSSPISHRKQLPSSLVADERDALGEREQPPANVHEFPASHEQPRGLRVASPGVRAGQGQAGRAERVARAGWTGTGRLE